MVGARRSWLVGLLTFAYACGASTDADPTATVNGAAPGAGVAGGPGGEPGTVATPGVTGPVFPDTLGARFDSTKTLVRIRVYSARATRIDAVFFANAVGETERVTVTLEAEAGSNVRSALVPVQKLRDAGIVGAIY